MSSEYFNKLYDVIDKILIPPGKYYSAHRIEEGALELLEDHMDLCSRYFLHIVKELDIEPTFDNLIDLIWVQNSVFEGELTKVELKIIKEKIREFIDQKQDSVRIYALRSDKYLKMIELGTSKVEISSIIRVRGCFILHSLYIDPQRKIINI